MTLEELRRELMAYGSEVDYGFISDHYKDALRFGALDFGSKPKSDGGTYVVVTAKSSYRGEKTYLAPVAWRVKVGDRVKVLQMNNWMRVTKVGTKAPVSETGLHVLRYHEPGLKPAPKAEAIQVYAKPGQAVRVYNANTRMHVGSVTP